MKEKDEINGSEPRKKAGKQINPPPQVTRFNTDLAGKVAEDALKLTAGKLSEEEFYHKHHKDYVNEFGVDIRPVTPALAPAVAPISRRTLLKVGGFMLAGMLGSAFLGRRVLATGNGGSGAFGQLLNSEGEPEGAPVRDRVQMGMVIDLEKCDGCLSCVFACNRHNSNPQGVFWIYVLAYEDENQDGLNFLVRPCQHCSNPPCVKVCPVRARHKREKDGLVLTDYNLCIGCRYCLVTCPFGVNYFQWDEPPPRKPDGVMTQYDYRGRWVVGNPPKGCMGKCEYCPERQDSGQGNVVCELTCPHHVIQFGNMNDPNSRPNQYLAQKKKEKGGELNTFRLLESHGTKPNVLYIGHEPSRSARAVEGPVSYADWGLVEKRLPLLGGYEPWWMSAFGGGQ